MTPSLTALAIQVIVGAAAYGAAALALDLAGCRAFILAKLRAARLHRPA
jgi:hypothetical protein